MSFFEFLIAPLIIFLVIVMPIWLVMHYRYKERASKTELNAEDSEVTQRLVALLEKMEGRIATLEKILDADDPRWRERAPQSEPH
ncbi:MAG: envelope stress response membrane protein PspB [Rhodospirillaceae bacterium]